MKFTGTINLDVRDLQLTHDYGSIVLNSGNKQISIRITKEAAELLQSYLVDALPNTFFSDTYKRYRNIDCMWNDMETVSLAFEALKESGEIPKDAIVEELSLDKLHKINDWRLKYYEKELGCSFSTAAGVQKSAEVND